ncbi:AAA family ATPase [Alkalilimnicola sp. S0819]|uniref:AAA family ATPase n=1 Tax=Alkalilimnicola sp. S0819 TaxID=2613922 RepID=UPI00126295E9|nr:AAA family ATPase [Alkalilimnicola sp. S0819]KAB7619763.1 AAA domain-containing protein [Alkalilimnicola sp. S0819]MPQ17527.1 AAA domain-containing protein [Alkalilimnicola sp. S0819]
MHAQIRGFLDQAGEVILGKQPQLRLALSCLLARGHLLIEDLPGVGKTTLSHTLAQLLGLDFQRIQFTSDMLPSDILGASVYERDTGAFRFHPGPVFHQLILADEINRATPKAQSALLEAMEEQQVTLEGETRALPQPFFVIATQNPDNQLGTFPLPESQLDRFLMRISLGYPDRAAERTLLAGAERRGLIRDLPAVLSPRELLAAQHEAGRVHCSEALLDYLQALLEHSRHCGRYRHGLSPRAGLALLRAARAWAWIDGRDAVLPEDVQAVFAPVAEHRLSAGEEHAPGEGARLLDEVAIP